MYYLDIDYDDLSDARDIIGNRGNLPIPYAAYGHPSDPDIHRMEFRKRENRDKVKNGLRRRGIECFPLDA